LTLPADAFFSTDHCFLSFDAVVRLEVFDFVPSLLSDEELLFFALDGFSTCFSVERVCVRLLLTELLLLLPVPEPRLFTELLLLLLLFVELLFTELLLLLLFPELFLFTELLLLLLFESDLLFTLLPLLFVPELSVRLLVLLL